MLVIWNSTYLFQLLKPYFTFLISIAICHTSFSGFSQSHPFSSKSYAKREIIGRYQALESNEVLILNADSSFYVLSHYSYQGDVVVPVCDTLARGYWRGQETFIVLQNETYLDSVDYSIKETKVGSDDSVYFKIVLPEDDALLPGKFKFSIIPSPLNKFIESNKAEFSAPLKNWTPHFGLSIQNMIPNSVYSGKAYHKIYINVFDDYIPNDEKSNYFIITLKNFTHCFYETMDIEGEVIGIKKDGLFWHGKSYKKVQ